MNESSPFDLEAALKMWRWNLGQSPQFRAENLNELEAHLRDSIATLRTKGLSDEEAYLIASRRIGSVPALEPEFAKVNLNPRNWMAHGAVLIFFSVSCFFLWLMLKLPYLSPSWHTGRGFPGFTQLCIWFQWIFYVLPVLAAMYFILICFRRGSRRHSWVGFFATSVGAVIILALPVLVAILLPMVDFMNTLPRTLVVPQFQTPNFSGPSWVSIFWFYAYRWVLPSLVLALMTSWLARRLYLRRSQN